jgi:hypothetical protein
MQHGIEGGRAPELRHIQAVLDRLAPEPTRAHDLRARWCSLGSTETIMEVSFALGVTGGEM